MFSPKGALEVCLASHKKKLESQSKNYILYVSTEQDMQNNRYTKKFFGSTMAECKQQLEAEPREYPHAFIVLREGKNETPKQYYMPAIKRRDKKTGQLKFRNYPKTA